MKSLKDLLIKEQIKREPIPLFSKLKELKLNQKKSECFKGIINQKHSQKSNFQRMEQSLFEQIRQKLERFKHQKALQLLRRQQKTGQDIDDIANSSKDQYQYQALCIIDQKYKRTESNTLKSPQEGKSTLPNSSQRQIDIQTPGFDLHSSKYQSSKRTALHQFTLGQRGGKDSSGQITKQYGQENSFVSQFYIKQREPASRKIKNKIMNPQKSRIDIYY